jgi:hypothetical protein
VTQTFSSLDVTSSWFQPMSSTMSQWTDLVKAECGGASPCQNHKTWPTTTASHPQDFDPQHVLMLSSYLVNLPSDLFPRGFPHKPYISSQRYSPTFQYPIKTENLHTSISSSIRNIPDERPSSKCFWEFVMFAVPWKQQTFRGLIIRHDVIGRD